MPVLGRIIGWCSPTLMPAIAATSRAISDSQRSPQRRTEAERALRTADEVIGLIPRGEGHGGRCACLREAERDSRRTLHSLATR